MYDELKAFRSDIIFLDHLPLDIHDRFVNKSTKNKLTIILDDVYDRLSNSQLLLEMFTKYSHHYSYSLFLVTHNLYMGKNLRTITLSCQLFILFNCLRDKSYVKYFSRQLNPSGPNRTYVERAFQASCENNKYGFLFISLQPQCDENLRYRTQIFNKPGPIIFQPPLTM